MTRQGRFSTNLKSLVRWVASRFPAAPLFLAAILYGASLAHAAQDASKDVPADVQEMIKDYFNDRFVYPDTTEWRFDFIAPYPGSERIVCGTMNYENARHQYVGEKHFFAIFDRKGINSSDITEDENEDRLGEGAFKLKTLCHLP